MVKFVRVIISLIRQVAILFGKFVHQNEEIDVWRMNISTEMMKMSNRKRLMKDRCVSELLLDVEEGL